MLLLGVMLSAAQTVQGLVTGAETAQPLGYAIVSMHPDIGGKQFADIRGIFRFKGVTAGTYLLSARQIGYAPLDTQIVVRDSVTTITVTLRRLAIELPPVTIAALPCNNPGPPDQSDSALFAVFDQLQENARRYELLTQVFPFQYTLELTDRPVNQRGDTGKADVRKLRFSSSDNHSYKVGRVVEPAWGPWGNPATVVVIHVADLQELGDANFIKNHCFRLAGMDIVGTDTLVRIDFDPALHIVTPDMAGSAYLDPVTYELRYTTTALTRPDRSDLTDVTSLTFLTRFRNIAPGVPLQDSLFSIMTYRYQRAKVHTQRTLEIQFTRASPDSSN